MTMACGGSHQRIQQPQHAQQHVVIGAIERGLRCWKDCLVVSVIAERFAERGAIVSTSVPAPGAEAQLQRP
jgi:hypothetical protein